MRSFSFVLAWFFACLVIISGEVQGVGYMTRYRKFGKDLRINQMISKPTKDFVSSGDRDVSDSVRIPSRVKPDGVGSDRKIKRGNQKISLDGKFDDTKFRANGISALNAFYPVSRAQRALQSIKYPTSHYEVHLDLGPKILSGGNTVQSLEHETDPNDLETTVRLGGEEFHAKVMAAAYEANKQFCTNVAQVDIPGLCNAFYTILYNSRQMYALLLTAMRTQNMINAVDEDGVYLAPIFCRHRMVNPKLGSGSAPWMISTYAFLNSSLVARMGESCFSGVMSNAAWAQMWASALTTLRLPQKWMKLLEDMFLTVKVVYPDDGSRDPRFVVLWPDGGYERWDIALSTISHEYVQGYYVQTMNQTQTVDIYTDDVDISNLATAVQEIETLFNMMMQTFPQLDIMFDLLKCKPKSNIDITRDITGKTLLLDYSRDIEDFIYSTATPFYTTTNASQSVATSYAMDPLNQRSILPQYWITMNADTRGEKKKSGRVDELAKCSLEYTNARDIDVPLHVLFYKHIAPINLTFYRLINNSNNPSHDATYNCVNLSNYWGLFNYLNSVSTSGFSAPNLSSMMSTWESLKEYQSFIVTPRDTIRGDTVSTSTNATLVANGMIPVIWHAEGTSSVPYYLYHCTTRDFLVPTHSVSQVINEFLDYLTC